MQLIFESEADTCIDRNMALVDKDSINEKFSDNNIIEKLTNSISNGNKENIEKQNNIEVDVAKETSDEAVDVSETDPKNNEPPKVDLNGVEGNQKGKAESICEVQSSEGAKDSSDVCMSEETEDTCEVSKSKVIEGIDDNHKGEKIPSSDHVNENARVDGADDAESTDIGESSDVPKSGGTDFVSDVLESDSIDVHKPDEISGSGDVHINRANDSGCRVLESERNESSCDVIKESSQSNTDDIENMHACIDTESEDLTTLENRERSNLEINMDQPINETSSEVIKIDNEEKTVTECTTNEICNSESIKHEGDNKETVDMQDSIILNNDQESDSATKLNLEGFENIVNDTSNSSNDEEKLFYPMEVDLTDKSNETIENGEEKSSRSIEINQNSVKIGVEKEKEAACSELDSEKDIINLQPAQGTDVEQNLERNFEEDSDSLREKNEKLELEMSPEEKNENESEDMCQLDSSSILAQNAADQNEKEETTRVDSPETEQNLDSDITNQKTKKAVKSKFSLNILSDDEEEFPLLDIEHLNKKNNSNKDLNEEEDEDDDIMVIDDESAMKVDGKAETTLPKNEPITETEKPLQDENEIKDQLDVEIQRDTKDKDELSDAKVTEEKTANEVTPETKDIKKPISPKPLLPKNFVSTCKKNLCEMTRNELEEFCILKIVESVLDRGNLSEIKSQMKKMSQTLEEFKNKANALTRQNQTLQVVLKSVQEELKKNTGGPITPLKISRSVGIQVLVAENNNKRKSIINNSKNLTNSSPVNKTIRGPPPLVAKSPKQVNTAQQIPVPRLVPANSGVKNNTPSLNQAAKSNNTASPGANKSSTKKPEKRPLHKIQNSDTVDLTDDEPPQKIVSRPTNNQSVRVVAPHNLMAPQRPQLGAMMNHPRKVYIPISGGQNQNVRPGQTLMLRAINSQNIRQRNAFRRSSLSAHPAPLPECAKQVQPPNWKLIPPAPDIKLSKVENGIVISWKFENCQEENYESIASYQIYAYQETTSPPNTNLWKKIGDVKALPLPMACTLTQFMSGYKYYFAVRAVDIRSRFGPFSSPGNIMLVNK